MSRYLSNHSLQPKHRPVCSFFFIRSILYTMYKVQWNISLIIIFILTISSLIGLLTLSYVQNLLSYSSDFYHYQKALYLARGWIDAQLVALNHHDAWYEHTINSWSTLVVWYNCLSNKICDIDSTIDGRRFDQWFGQQPVINDECTNENAYSLWSGESVVLPLYYDHGQDTNGNDNIELISLLDPSLDIVMQVIKWDSLWLWFAIWPWGETNVDRDLLFQIYSWETVQTSESTIITEFLNDTTPLYFLSGIDTSNDIINPKSAQFSEFNNFLVIMNPALSWETANINPQGVQFCLKQQGGDEAWLPIHRTVIASRARYGSVNVWIEAVRTITYPDFLFTTFVRR